MDKVSQVKGSGRYARLISKIGLRESNATLLSVLTNNFAVFPFHVVVAVTVPRDFLISPEVSLILFAKAE